MGRRSLTLAWRQVRMPRHPPRGAFLPLPHCLAALLIFLSATSWQVAGALAAAPAGTLAGAGQLGAYGRGRRISTALRHGKQEQGQGRKFRGRVLQDTGGGGTTSHSSYIGPSPSANTGPNPAPSGLPVFPGEPQAPGPAPGGALLPEASDTPAPDSPASDSSDSTASVSVSASASGGAPPKARPVEAVEAGVPPGQPGEWRPQPGKFLLAICLYGRMSNQLSCMRSYFRTAVLTSRALLVPTWGVAVNLMRKVEYTFPWDVPVDWARIAKCLEPGYGPQTVMTVKQYLQQYNRTFLNVTNFRGLQRSRDWAWSGGGGGVVKEFLKLNSQELEIPAWKDVPETGWLQHIPGKLTPADVAFLGRALQDDVISFGELFNSFLAQPLPPLSIPDRACSNLWRPHPGIVQFVEGVRRSKIGGPYGALHFRRGDFYEYKRRQPQITEREFPSAVAAGTGVREWLSKHNLTRLFVATNARPIELDVFKAVVSEPVDGFQVQAVVSLRDLLADQDWLKQQEWAQPALALDRMEGIGGLIWSTVDKYVCVYSDVFWGSSGSTFSGEISWTLRKYEFQGSK